MQRIKLIAAVLNLSVIKLHMYKKSRAVNAEVCRNTQAFSEVLTKIVQSEWNMKRLQVSSYSFWITNFTKTCSAVISYMHTGRVIVIGVLHRCDHTYIAVFLNCWAAARYWALASIIPGRKRPEEITICYRIPLVQLITNLNVILYLSSCHTSMIIP
jgi:hypothetical protein